MSLIIKDGTGKNYAAQVNANNKLATESVSTGRAAYFADAEESSFLIATGGFISLSTTETETGILYVQYTGNGHLHITSVRTCGTQANRWLMYRNPTGGTLISAASAGSCVNTNVTSSNLMPGLCYKGVDGSTLTGGTIMENWINAMGHSTEEFDGVVILGKNDSVALTCIVSAAASVCARILAFEDTGSTL